MGSPQDFDLCAIACPALYQGEHDFGIDGDSSIDGLEGGGGDDELSGRRWV